MKSRVLMVTALMVVGLAGAPCGAGFNPADINGDGIVDLPDFARVAGHWMILPADPCADIDDDGNVDIDDLVIVADNWLWQAPTALLADNGQALLSIVIRSTTEDYHWGSPCPTNGEKQVAYELAGILGEITGADFEVLIDGVDHVVIASNNTPIYALDTVGGLAVNASDNVLVGEDNNTGPEPGTYTIFDGSGGAGLEIIDFQIVSGWQRPQGIDIAADGTVAVAIKNDYGEGEVQFFDSGGSYLRGFSLNSYGGCTGVTFDAAGNVWVTSEISYGVRRFHSGTGSLLQEVTTTPGLNRTFVYKPLGVAVDDSGRVYVADYCRVVRFNPANPSGTMELFAGLPGGGFPTGSGDGEFKHDVGGIDIGADGRVYVADKNNHRVQVFESNGTFVRVVGEGVLLYGTDVAVDSAGNVYGFSEDTINDEYELYKFFADTASATSEGIFVGTLADFPEFGGADPSIEPALELRGKYYDGVGSYVIRTDPNRVLILGRTPLGVSHGVSGFLKELGYRLFAPGENWEYVPSLPTLSVSINIDDRPDFLSYEANYGYGDFDAQCQADYEEWSRRNRKGKSLPTYFGHAW